MSPSPNAGPKTTQDVALSAHDAREHSIVALAVTQHGLITAAQLRELGLSSSGISSRARRGRLHRIHAGVFSIGCPPSRPEQFYLAAVLACGERAVLSHRSAADLWGVRRSESRRIDVISPRRAGRSREGITVHRAGRLAPSDIAEVRGVPCTALPRTLLDLAAVVHRESLEYAIHQAQRRKRLDLAAMHDLLARYPNQPGAGALREALGDPDLDKKINSGVERRFLRLCRRYGIPEPKVNLWIPLPGLFGAGGVEVDFCWPEARLVVETDGAPDHSTFRAASNDPARDRALRLGGWTVFRYPASDLRRFGEAATQEILAMLAGGRAPT